jgi:exopolysaccharide biosynthesis polyprenyl glycosylphosphotransferase
MSILKRSSLSFIQKSIDALSCALFFTAAYFIRFEYMHGAQEGIELTFIKMTPFLIFSTLYSFHNNNLYKAQRFASKYYEILSVVKGNTAGIIGFVIALYFFGEERLSRLTILLYWAISTFGFIIIRLLVRNFLRTIREKGHNLRHILLIGNGYQLTDYVRTARYFKDSGIRFLGWIDPPKDMAKEYNIPEISKNYDDYKKENIPDAIIIAYSGNESVKSSDFIKTHYNDVIPIQLLPDLSYSMVGHQIEDFGGIPLLSVNQPTLNPVELFFKRLFEFAATVIGLIIISPLLLIISLAIKQSSKGPIFFGQERIGLDGSTFKMWKFRTMKVATEGEDTKEWSSKDNPRKTKIGLFLRKSSLDELPQLWNVLIGDMSLVGPRPEQPFFVEKFRNKIPGYMLKHKMKPGITGWAQINGWRGDTSLEKRIECDIYYIKHWSIFFDIKILFLTFFKGFINKNAY